MADFGTDPFGTDPFASSPKSPSSPKLPSSAKFGDDPFGSSETTEPAVLKQETPTWGEGFKQFTSRANLNPRNLFPGGAPPSVKQFAGGLAMEAPRVVQDIGTDMVLNPLATAASGFKGIYEGGKAFIQGKSFDEQVKAAEKGVKGWQEPAQAMIEKEKPIGGKSMLFNAMGQGYEKGVEAGQGLLDKYAEPSTQELYKFVTQAIPQVGMLKGGVKVMGGSPVKAPLAPGEVDMTPKYKGEYPIKEDAKAAFEAAKKAKDVAKDLINDPASGLKKVNKNIESLAANVLRPARKSGYFGGRKNVNESATKVAEDMHEYSKREDTSFLDEKDNIVSDRAPETVHEMVQVAEQRMPEIWDEVTKEMESTGNGSFSVKPLINDLVKKAEHWESSPLTEHLGKSARAEIAKLETLESQGGQSLRRLNEDLKILRDQMPGTFNATNIIPADVLAPISKFLREQGDAAVEHASTTGTSNYLKNRKLYAQYSQFQKNMIADAQKTLQLKTKDATNTWDMVAGLEGLSGIFHMDPAMMGIAIATKQLNNWKKRQKNPDTMVRRLFQDLDKKKAYESRINPPSEPQTFEPIYPDQSGNVARGNLQITGQTQPQLSLNRQGIVQGAGLPQGNLPIEPLRNQQGPELRDQNRTLPAVAPVTDRGFQRAGIDYPIEGEVIPSAPRQKIFGGQRPLQVIAPEMKAIEWADDPKNIDPRLTVDGAFEEYWKATEAGDTPTANFWEDKMKNALNKDKGSSNLYEGTTGIFKMLQEEIKKEGGKASAVAKVAMKYGIPAALLAKFLASDDEGREKMMGLPAMVGMISFFGKNGKVPENVKSKGHSINILAEKLKSYKEAINNLVVEINSERNKVNPDEKKLSRLESQYESFKTNYDKLKDEK